MQTLHVYQSLWGMEKRSPHEPERTPETSFRMVADAGFDGMCIDPAAHEIDKFMPLRDLYRSFGLDCMVNAFPAEEDDMQPLLDLAAAFDARQVNVISGVMPMRPEDAVPVVRRWMQQAAAAGLTLLFETHRDSLLNDLYFTLQLIDLVPDMRLCADLSHFVVDREFRLPLPECDRRRIDKILGRSDCFQGRVASREQIQVALDFSQHREWVRLFRDWWKQGMRLWRDRNDSDATLIFLCELGPPPYAITDHAQRELSDRWQESLKLRDWALEIWQELDGES